MRRKTWTGTNARGRRRMRRKQTTEIGRKKEGTGGEREGKHGQGQG